MKHLLFSIALLLLVTAAFGQSDISQSSPIRFDVWNMDISVDPCVDFYRYACGGWMKSNPIPGDQTR